MLRRFCEESLYLYEDVNFDFDVSSITNDNLDECIRNIGRNLFSQRPTTAPYVQSFMMFGAYVNQQLKDESWYREAKLVSALKSVLDETNFRLPLCSRLGYMIEYISNILSFTS